MAALKSTLSLLLLVTFAFKETHQQCTDLHGRTYCNSLRDFYANVGDRDVHVSNASTTNLEELKPIPFETAHGIKSLTIQYLLNGIHRDAFKQFDVLNSMSLDFNTFDTIPHDTFGPLNIKWLHLQNDKIRTIEDYAFRGLNSLEKLRLRSNRITTITRNTFGYLLPIKSLDLGKNSIYNIAKRAFYQLPNLEALLLDDNILSKFYVQDFVESPQKLEKLWLHKNQIKEVTAYMLQGLTSLTILNLGSNQIASVEPNAFAETPNLKLLVLSHNLLTAVDGRLLPAGGLSHLEILYLDNNRLTYLLSSFLFRAPQLRAMSLGGNPWQCSCLDWVLKWLDEKHVRLSCDQQSFDGSRPVCVATGSACSYSYDENHNQLFQNAIKGYPPLRFCLL